MLELSHIHRKFGDRTVLNDVSFAIEPGKITGFIGGNGAGKTTTMRILLGVLSPTSGEVLLDGVPITSNDRHTFGYMPEERGLYPKMRILEQLVFFARLHGLSREAATRNATLLLDELGLAERAQDAVETLSLGNQQRAQIAAALVHSPSVLVLDEPFSGLDPMAVDAVLAVLQRRANQGASVLFSSHQLDIVERLCDSLTIISGGSIRASGNREELRARFGGLRFEVECAGDTGWIRDMPGISGVEFAGGFAAFDATDHAAAQSVLQRALAFGAVHRFAPAQVSLSTIFREVVAA